MSRITSFNPHPARRPGAMVSSRTIGAKIAAVVGWVALFIACSMRVRECERCAATSGASGSHPGSADPEPSPIILPYQLRESDA